MKSKYSLLAVSLVMSVSSFAQKDELKLAEKQLKKENLTESSAALSQAEALLGNATAEEKVKFYFIQGKLGLALANNANENEDKSKNLNTSAKAFLDMIDLDSTSGKGKYTKLSEEFIIELRRELINSAVADNEAEKFDLASGKLYQSYLLDKTDTIKLYFAASSAVTGTHYDKALEYYKELVKVGFTGKTKSYTAVNKSTNELENFGPSSVTRDLMVSQGTHTNPRVHKEESKRGEIVKNIALIYNINGDTENAKKAIVEARKENPEDVSLIQTEANMYLESKEMDKYESLIKEAIAKSPNNALLYYNLGIVSANSNNTVKAKEYYLKAIEIDSKYEDAYINLASVILVDEKLIVEEMNNLGTSSKDNMRYDELKAKREGVFESAVPYLTKVLEINPTNAEAGLTLANIYGVLGKYEESKELKAKFAE